MEVYCYSNKGPSHSYAKKSVTQSQQNPIGAVVGVAVGLYIDQVEEVCE